MKILRTKLRHDVIAIGKYDDDGGMVIYKDMDVPKTIVDVKGIRKQCVLVTDDYLNTSVYELLPFRVDGRRSEDYGEGSMIYRSGGLIDCIGGYFPSRALGSVSNIDELKILLSKF